MSKVSCNTIKDILPLYVDEVVSEDTRTMVAEHLEDCAECSKKYEAMKSEIAIPVESNVKPLKSFKKAWKKKKIVLISSTILITIATLVIVSAVYVSSRLPDGFGIGEFTKGVIATGIKNEPFAEVSPNEFFFKDGNLETVIEHLEDSSIMFDEQFGSALIFTYEGTTVKASLQAITRWHYLLIIDDIGPTTEPDA